MARIYYVKKARKSPGPCGACHDDIAVGQPYRYWEFRYAGKRVRCMKNACAPRPSELVASDKISRVYAATEELDAALQGCEDLESAKSAVEDAANAVREVADEYQEAADAFNCQGLGEQHQEKADEISAYADELENCLDGIDEDAFNLDEIHEAVEGVSCPV
jgi:DNA repair ATPase RecN